MGFPRWGNRVGYISAKKKKKKKKQRTLARTYTLPHTHFLNHDYNKYFDRGDDEKAERKKKEKKKKKKKKMKEQEEEEEEKEKEKKVDADDDDYDSGDNVEEVRKKKSDGIETYRDRLRSSLCWPWQK